MCEVITLVSCELGDRAWNTSLPLVTILLVGDEGAVIEFGFLNHYKGGLTTGKKHGELANTLLVSQPTDVIRDHREAC